nr:SDR family oxidoreductase [Azospirillum picis]
MNVRRCRSTLYRSGPIDTPLHVGMTEVDRWAMFEMVSTRLSARRIGQPGDVAQAILFVATNSFVTGTAVTVDGGGMISP